MFATSAEPWNDKHRPIGARAAGDHHERDEPREDADREGEHEHAAKRCGDCVARWPRARAKLRPACCGLQTQINGNVSHATCDRNPVASAAQNAATYNCRALVDASVSTWTPTAAARPRHVAQRPRRREPDRAARSSP